MKSIFFSQYNTSKNFFYRKINRNRIQFITKIADLGHDKMILCLATAHASTFNTSRQIFFLIKSACEAFLSFGSFNQQTFLAAFCLILLHLSIQILTLKVIVLNHHGILASAIIYINCENQLGFLVLYSPTFTCVRIFYCRKKNAGMNIFKVNKTHCA